MEREAVVWNCSCVDTLIRTVLHRTVPKDRVNGKPIRTYAERFHTKPFQSPVQTQPKRAVGGFVIDSTYFAVARINNIHLYQNIFTGTSSSRYC